MDNINLDIDIDEITSIRQINKKNAEFYRTPGGFAGLKFDGKDWGRVRILRLFPYTSPWEYIAVRTADEHSREIGVVIKIGDVSKESEKIIREQLNLHYFTPVITKIIDIKDEYGYAYFHVLTDKGECRFTINMGGNSVVRLSDVRLIISDLDENRFEIPDLTRLTPKEQRKLDLFL